MTNDAASETPQDAREVERRERWLRQHPDGDMGWEKIGRYDQRVVTNLMAEADREQVALVAERDALQRDLAQAVAKERMTALALGECRADLDRLREGIKALHHPSVEVPGWCQEEGFSWPCATALLLATPDADAHSCDTCADTPGYVYQQGEVGSGVGGWHTCPDCGPRPSRRMDDDFEPDADAQDEGVRRG